MSTEIIGPSGSGKSFYLRNFKRINKKQSFLFFISFDFLKMFIVISYLNFKHTLINSKYLSFSNKIKLFLKKEKYFFNFNTNIYHKYYFKNDEKYIDEGYVSFFINLMESHDNFEKDFELYFNNLTYKPRRLLIIQNSDINKLIINMDKRKRWPRRDLGVRYFNNFLSNQIKTISKILVYNKKKGIFKIKIVNK